MTELEFIIMIVLIFMVMPVLMVFLLIWWLWNNPVNVQISEKKEGVYLSSGGKYRIRDGKLYPIWSFFTKISRQWLAYDVIISHKTIEKAPFKLFGGVFTFGKSKTIKKVYTKRLAVDYADIKDYLIITEGFPIIGAKLTLKLKREKSQLVPWLPKIEADSKGVTTNTRMVKIDNLREQLYETTKTPLSKNDMMLKVVLPMSLVLLAIVLIIFFPKIYEAVMAGSQSAFDQSKSAVFDWLQQNPPQG